MKIKSVHIKNFRAFADETFDFDDHTCLLGPNGAGKSSVLAALNVFFQESASATDVTSLTDEDFHKGNTAEPVEITVTFTDLSDEAKDRLSHYVRHDEFTATAEAVYSDVAGKARVELIGERLVYAVFSPFFLADKNGMLLDDLRPLFAEIVAEVEGFPDLGKKPSKKAMIAAMREFEEAHPELCTPERSDDLLYGKSKGKHILEQFVQWVYLPAVKDASEEAEETGNTALAKLLQRTVRRKINFDEAIDALRATTRQRYDEILEAEQDALKDISDRLGARLATYSHADASLDVMWLQDGEKSVAINDPKATIRAREGVFRGSLPRFGHGLQRSFLLAILQELATLEEEFADDGDEDEGVAPPTLILACEEPELYQHPPQARHLASVLRTLSDDGSQVLLTTHSPYFASGTNFEEIRLIRKDRATDVSSMTRTTFAAYADRLAKITGSKPDKPTVAQAKLYAALQPEAAELFFSSKVAFVEGIEDRAYLSAALILEGKWEAARRTGFHIITAGKKSYMLPLLVTAQLLDIPAFVMFDADGDKIQEEQRKQHERDNGHLIAALESKSDIFPDVKVIDPCHAIWPSNIEAQIKAEIGTDEWAKITAEARKAFDPGASLKKNPLLIAEALRIAWDRDKKPPCLIELANTLLAFSES